MEDQETLVRMGEEAEVLLDSEAFSSTINQLVDGYSTFANTGPVEAEKREAAYHNYRSLVDIVSTLRQRVSVTKSSARKRMMTPIKRRMRTMQNVQNQLDERRPMDLPEAEDTILARWEDPDEQVSDDDEPVTLDIENEETEILEGSEEDFDEADLDDEEADPEEEDDEPDDQEEEDDEAEAELVDDDAEVEILVDGETHRASVKSLKRLFGVEKSLTRKSQHVAQQRKQAEDASKLTLCCKRCF